MMGWSIGYDSNWRRDIGYGVVAYCDHPRCQATIDRGLAHVCGGERPYGGDHGCGLYFCSAHLFLYQFRGERAGFYCLRCGDHKPPYRNIKPEHPDWVRWKLTDESWAAWRRENPREVETMQQMLRSIDHEPIDHSNCPYEDGPACPFCGQ